MTDEEIEQAEKDAEDDAEWLLLLLLLLLHRKTKDKKGNARVVFRADVGRFYIDGKSVSITTVREYLNRIESRFAKKLNVLLSDLEYERIPADQWEREMQRTIKSSHILAGALAVGGIAAAARNRDVQQRIAAELKYADTFAKQVRTKKAGTFARIKARAKSYLRAATITYGVLEQKARGVVGIQTECRRIRRASESCPGCREYSYRWMPIAKMPPIGSLDCGGRCRCYLEYR